MSKAVLVMAKALPFSRQSIRRRPQPGEVKRKLAVVPDGQQVDRGAVVHGCVQHQIVAVQVLAKSMGSAGRQRGELGQRLGRLRRIVQIAPTDAREAGQVGDDRGAQLRQQVVEGKGRVCFGQERLDGVQTLQEARGQLDPVDTPQPRFLAALPVVAAALRRAPAVAAPARRCWSWAMAASAT